jgi:hypothetical protein
MVVNHNNTIKLSPKIAISIIVFVILGFLSMVLISKQKVSKYFIANFETKIVSTVVTGEFGGGRGGIGYKKNHFISTSAILIENKSRYNKWKTNGPIIDLNSDPHSYTLDDLALPYTISKNAYSDTLFVEKEGNVLLFLMVRED